MGVVSNNWLDRAFLSIRLHVQTLMMTDVQTPPSLGPPLVPLKNMVADLHFDVEIREHDRMRKLPRLLISTLR